MELEFSFIRFLLSSRSCSFFLSRALGDMDRGWSLRLFGFAIILSEVLVGRFFVAAITFNL